MSIWSGFTFIKRVINRNVCNKEYIISYLVSCLFGWQNNAYESQLKEYFKGDGIYGSPEAQMWALLPPFFLLFYLYLFSCSPCQENYSHEKCEHYSYQSSMHCMAIINILVIKTITYPASLYMHVELLTISLSLKENILFSILIRCLTTVYYYYISYFMFWCLPVTCTCMPFWNAIVLRPLSPKCFLNRLEQRWVWHFPYHVTKKMK